MLRFRPTTAATGSPVTQPRVFKRPELRSLGSERDEGYIPRFTVAPIPSASSVQTSGRPQAQSSDADLGECVPFLKGINNLQQGSEKGSMIWKFLKHMNQNALKHVRNFVEVSKEDERKKGHLVDVQGDQKCCSTPWAETADSVCYERFARCDGGCIPEDWVSDGWPDCIDGADESNLHTDGKVMPHQLGCIHCGGVILSAGFLCQQSEGLTRSCVESIMGPGQCNVCIDEYVQIIF